MVIRQRDCSKYSLDLVKKIGAPSLQVTAGTAVEHDPSAVWIDRLLCPLLHRSDDTA